MSQRMHASITLLMDKYRGRESAIDSDLSMLSEVELQALQSLKDYLEHLGRHDCGEAYATASDLQSRLTELRAWEILSWLSRLVWRSLSLNPGELEPQVAQRVVEFNYHLNRLANVKLLEHNPPQPLLVETIADIEEGVARRLGEGSGPVAFLMVTEGYLRNLKLWLEVATATGQRTDRVIVFCLDHSIEKVEALVRQYSTGMMVHHVRFAESLTVHGSGRNNAFIWYVKVRILLAFLEQHAAVSYSDLDSFWVKNIMDYCFNVVDEEVNLVFLQAKDMPKYAVLMHRFVLCCGFLAVRPSEASQRFLREWLTKTELMLDDQIGVFELLRERRMCWRDSATEGLNKVGTLFWDDGISCNVGVLPQRVAIRGHLDRFPDAWLVHPRWKVSQSLTVSDILRAS